MKASFDTRRCCVCEGDDDHDYVTPRLQPTSSAVIKLVRAKIRVLHASQERRGPDAAAIKVARAKIRALCTSRERRGEDNLNFFKNNATKK